MSLTQPRKWLIAYDVREPRRLKRVHALLKKTAVPVQYSVFATVGSTLAMRQLAAAVADRIDAGVDDVRFYPIPGRPLVYTIGGAMLPDDVLLLDARTDLEALLGRKPARQAA